MFKEYHELMKKYTEVRRNYYDQLEERARLISSVDLQSSKVKEIVTNAGGQSYDSKFITYADQKEELDKLINTARNDKEMYEHGLKELEKEIRQSTDVYDRVYLFKWIEHRKVRDFYRLLGYSKPQVYRFITDIKNMIKNEKKIDL